VLQVLLLLKVIKRKRNMRMRMRISFLQRYVINQGQSGLG
jgi:hypothetical protein